MLKNIILRFSTWAYRALIQLYPAEHREQYGLVMQLLFEDQCGDARKRGGIMPVLGLWFRTGFDFLATVFSEHIAAADLRAEIINPDPFKRLPWKSVALVLLPGIVVSASQLLSLTGNSWYYEVHSKLGLYMMVPVVVAWIWTRKFPLWGLLPLGMAIYNLTVYDWYSLIMRYLPESVAANIKLLMLYTSIYHSYGVAIMDASWVDEIGRQALFSECIYLGELALLGILGILFIRRWLKGLERPRRSIWVWMMACLILGLAGGMVILNAYPRDAIKIEIGYSTTFVIWEAGYLISIAFQYFSLPVQWLFLLGIAALFAKRYGSWSVLLLLGFMLPEVLIGFMGTDAMYSYQIGLIVAWRLGLGMVAPLLLMRSSATRNRYIALFAPLGVILAIRLLSEWMSWFLFGFPFTQASEIVMYVGPDLLRIVLIPVLFLLLSLELFSLRSNSSAGSSNLSLEQPINSRQTGSY